MVRFSGAFLRELTDQDSPVVTTFYKPHCNIDDRWSATVHLASMKETTVTRNYGLLAIHSTIR